MSLGRAPWGLGVVQRSGAPGTGAVAAFVSRELDRFWPLPASCAGAGGRFLQPVLEAWAREGAPPEYSQAQGVLLPVPGIPPLFVKTLIY